MKNLKKYNDYEIVVDEYKRFKDTIKSLKKETPYYVYALCHPNGEPFYIGKGKGTRAFDHLNGVCSKSTQKIIDGLNNEAPIVFLLKTNLKENDALILEQSYIEKYGRQNYGGQLSNFMPNGTHNSIDVASEAGKIGGRTTKSRNVGIFSPDYDRGVQSSLNYQMGLIDVDHVAIGKLGGKIAVEQQLGIHDPKYDDKRFEWASNGGKSVINRGGVCSEQWQKENTDKIKENASKGGKIGGKILGSRPWWNNGVINKKSDISPGEGWVRGMLMSEKKRASLFGRNKVKDTPSNSINRNKEI